jgi:hypothetical protein
LQANVTKHALQLAYYTQLDRLETSNSSTAAETTESFIASLGATTDLEHVQHCFDYIRQALLCAADTNLETANVTTGKTNGWGFERTCRSYEDVVKWAEKWRNNQETTILSGAKHYDHEG